MQRDAEPTNKRAYQVKDGDFNVYAPTELTKVSNIPDDTERTQI